MKPKATRKVTRPNKAKGSINRGRIEMRLRESEERYRSLFENSTDAILLTATDGRIFAANPEACRILQRTEHEICQIGRDGVVDLNDPRLPHALQERTRTGRFKGQLNLKRKDGTIFPAEVSTNVFKGVDDPQATSMIIRDISDRKRTEGAGLLLAAIVESSDDAILGNTLDGVITSWNRAAERLYGYSAEEVNRKSISILIPPNRSEELKQIVERVKRGESTRHYETQRVRKDGKIIDVSLTVSPIQDAGGTIVGASTIARDITGRKRVEERLRESEERYRSLFDRMLSGVYRSTHEGRFLDVNPAFVKMFGYSSREEMLAIPDIGKALYFSPEERGKHIPQTAEKGVEVFPMRRKDGSMIWVEDHGGYVHDEHGNVIFHEGILRDVTERREAEELLRASEAKYRWLFEKIPHAIYQTSPDGKPLTVNPAFINLFGYNSEKEFAAIDVERDLYANPEDRKRWRRDVEAQGEVRDVEMVLKRKNGEKITVLDSGHVVRDGKGVIQYYEGTLTDITERKKMEDRLRLLHEHALRLASAKELTEIVKSTLDAMEFMLGFDHADFWMVSGGLISVQGSRGVPFHITELHVGGPGVIVKAARTKSTVRISDTREDPTFIDDPATAISGESLHMLSELAVPILVSNEAAAVLNVENTALNAFDEQDQMLLEILASHVASALNRLRAQGELRRYSENLEELVEERTRKLTESEARFREMADLLPQIVFEIDEQGNFTFANRSGIASSGYTEADLRAGLNALQVFTEQDRDRVRENMARVLAGQDMGPNEYTAQRKDGSTFPVIIHATAIIHGGKPVGLRGIAIDITERKDMETRLLKAEHLAAIGETASMVAHDLRNPLQGIGGATYLLRSEELTADERDEMLRLIEDNVEYSDGIVKDLLDYSRTFQLVLSETTPKKIIARALQVAKVPDRIKVENFALEEPVITVDPDRMKRVFVNLAENAVDAMPNEGLLTISSKESNGFVEIVFTDTGTGMPKGVMQNLWKPLQTTKPKGMGMGLAIVKRIVDAHGGSVSVQDGTGKGTTISVLLPLIPKAVSKG